MRVNARVLATVLVLALVLSITGCAVKGAHAPPHPNAVSALDSTAYDALTIAQSALVDANKNLAIGVWPASYRPTVDKVGHLYDVATASWKAYRTVLQAQGDASQAAAKLQTDLNQLSVALAAMLNEQGVKP